MTIARVFGPMVAFVAIVSAGTPAAAAKGVAPETIARWEAACAKDDAEACFFAGIMYGKGADVPQDYTKAAAYFEKACDGKDADGCYMVGLSYVAGKGVPVDIDKARAFAQRAIAINPEHTDAIEFLEMITPEK